MVNTEPEVAPSVGSCEVLSVHTVAVMVTVVMVIVASVVGSWTGPEVELEDEIPFEEAPYEL